MVRRGGVTLLQADSSLSVCVDDMKKKKKKN